MLSATGAAAIGAAPVSVTGIRDPRSFAGVLRRLRPRLAVVASPPAGPDELGVAVAERHRRPMLRLIYLNEPGDVAGRLAALADGFDEALPATVDPVELSGRARLLVGDPDQRRGADEPLELAIATVLDRTGHRLWRGGTEVHLRPKEFALLCLLASAPGRAFSREELLARVWGGAYHGGSRTVDVHIRWLRAKVESDPARPRQLITVRGTGYRLDIAPTDVREPAALINP